MSYDEETSRVQKLKRLKEMNLDPYFQFFKPNSSASDIKDRFSTLSPGDHISSVDIRLAGRVVLIRDFGGSIFFHIQDQTGKIQCFIERKLSEEKIKFFRDFIDTGDILGVRGDVFRTKKGEITIYVRDFVILSKCLRSLPEKWHGLKDVELRYRKRYVDLFMNQEVREIFHKKSKIISHIRDFLSKRGFLEVETPILQYVPSGAFARPFKTYHNELEMSLFLRIAPELYLKKLIVGGFEKVFEIGRNFRNEGLSAYHNPEFTMLELYQAYSNYEDLMMMTEILMYELAQLVNGEPYIKDPETQEKISVDIPFRRVSICEEVAKLLEVDKEDLKDIEILKRKLGGKIDFTGKDWGAVVLEVFEKYIASGLRSPTFVVDFPVSTSPLAKRKSSDPDYVERFELYILGIEVANAFSELNDPEDQRKRFEELMRKREMREIFEDVDWDFIAALEYGMPPTAGEGIGIDRLTMILLGLNSIKEVILFPTLKPE